MKPSQSVLFGKKRNSKTAFLLAPILLALFISTSCSMLPKEEETLAPPLKVPEKITFETLEVVKGTIERKIRVTGRFISVSQSNAQFKERGGRLEEIKVRVGGKVKKGDILATLDTETLGDDIRLQKIALERSKLSYEKIKQTIETNKNANTDFIPKADADAAKIQNEFDLSMTKLDVESNEIRLIALQRAFDESQLLSPIDGDVIYASDVKTGDWINTFTTVVTIADPTKLQLRYSEDRVGDFSTGMQVTVNINNVAYNGEVVMTPVDLPADATESMKNTILVDVEDMPEDMRIGGDAQIVATLDKKDNTIVLPRYALNKNFGRTYVNVLKNNIREERDVEIGIQSDTEIEVVKGLELGDLVIIR